MTNKIANMSTVAKMPKIIKQNISKKEFRLIDFHIYDEKPENETSSDEDDNNAKMQTDNLKFIIEMFGINELGETCCITIDDFYPFFYVKVGDTWTKTNMLIMLNKIRQKINHYYENSIIDAELIDSEKLYGFSNGEKSRFIKLTFKNTAVMNKVKNLWFEERERNAAFGGGERKRKPYFCQNESIELYESQIPPILRYFHIYGISPSGWISVSMHQMNTSPIKRTTCLYEFSCNVSQIIPMPQKETIVPYKICSFDIEASSSHGDFPLPKKSYKRLATNIVDLFAIEVKTRSSNENGYAGYSPQRLLTNYIFSAFGFRKNTSIDLVYPKCMPTKNELEEFIDIIISMDMSNEQSTPEIVELLTIDEIFKSNNITVDDETFNSNGKDNDDAENDDADNNTDHDFSGEEPADIDLEYCDVIVVSAKTTKTAKSAKLANTKTANSKNTSLKNKKNGVNIIDILNDVSITREKRILSVNTILTDVLPRLEGDKVTFIGSTFMRYGEREPYLNHCLVLNSCDDVEGTTIVSVEHEDELLIKWAELIQEQNPDIIIGYNIFGFDYEFMFRRAEELNCTFDFLRLSRKVGEICINQRTTPPTIESKTIVLATGEYNLKFPAITGRVQLDLYCYFRREFNLPSYKLDDVAGENISDTISSVVVINADTTATTAKLYTKNMTGLHKNDYIHIELQSFTTNYYCNGRKYYIVDMMMAAASGGCGEAAYIEITGDPAELIALQELALNKKITLKWCIAKDDVTPQDIFRLTDGSSADRAKVAKYCIQDCNLVHHLMNKIDVLTSFIEMSSICSVPISFLIFRGQGIKLTSFVAKKCREKNILMPDLEKSYSTEGYEGAIVLSPKCAMYMDTPVACVDYSSLYPSAMISQNLSHDSKVWTKKYDIDGGLIRETGVKNAKGEYIYDNLAGYEYINIEFDTFEYRRNTPKAKAKKVKVGTKICRWAQFPDGRYGVMPSILKELLGARAATRKKIKTEPDPFMQNILEKRQLGYKVTANSLYGQCGAKTSTFYEQDIAASTTATGRMMIIYAKTIIEEVYGAGGTGSEYTTKSHGLVNTSAEYVYGDSVANYTPVYLRIDGRNLCVCTIEQAATMWGHGVSSVLRSSQSESSKTYKNQIATQEQESFWVSGDDDKEYCELTGVESWTESGWTQVSRIIRHQLAPHKKMVRVLTHTGLVDCTDDHSLLAQTGEPISPKDIHVGDTLLHHTLDVNSEFADTINDDDDLYYENEAYEMGISLKEWIENPTIANLCLRTRWEIKDITKVANIILESDIKIRKTFMIGLCGIINDSIIIKIDNKMQIVASFIILLANSLDYSVTITTENDFMFLTISHQNKYGEEISQDIQKMHEIDYTGEYVYDLTTENHHFAAGVGNMIVHNTDSVFFKFNLKDPVTKKPIVGNDALEITIELAQDAANLCTKWLKPPMELTYEKTLMPFILLSKKRYVGMLYTDAPTKGKLKYMGLSLKRRDSCDYLKDTYGEILNILIKEQNINKAVTYLQGSLQQLIDGIVPMDKLIITKALRSEYANPDKIAHKVLADRIKQRDEGNAPKSGDRMRFVHIVPNTSKNINIKLLQGDKIETPEFIVEHNLKIDYTFYITNQLMKPLQQLMGLALNEILTSQNKLAPIKQFEKDMAKIIKTCGNDNDLFVKTKEKYTSAEIKKLLFDQTLKKLYNAQHNIQTIDRWVVSSKK